MRHAQCSGVESWSFLAPTSAPALSRISTIPAWPFAAAMCSADRPDPSRTSTFTLSWIANWTSSVSPYRALSRKKSARSDDAMIVSRPYLIPSTRFSFPENRGGRAKKKKPEAAAHASSSTRPTQPKARFFLLLILYLESYCHHKKIVLARAPQGKEARRDIVSLR